jgi:hypothetical protein
MMILLLFSLGLWDYSYNVSAVSLYDDNIFAYSPERIQEFIDYSAPYKYPFETYDDLRTSASVSLRLRNKFIEDRTTTFNLGVDVHHYLNNQEKDFQNISIGIRQSFKTFAVKMTYTHIPEYLIRYYRNPAGSSTDYIGCDVQYRTLSGKISLLRLLPFGVHLTYARRWEDYIEEFDLYDARAHLLGIYADLQLVHSVALKLGYQFRTQESDSASAVVALDDVPDGSFFQQAAQARLDVMCKLLFPGMLTLGYDYAFRNHRADDVQDIYHYGRQDHVHTVRIERTARIFTGMEFVVSYMKRWRNATSEIYPALSSIKDYDKYRLGAGLNFYF